MKFNEYRAAWAIRVIVKRGVVGMRIARGWDPIVALTSPIKPGVPLRVRP